MITFLFWNIQRKPVQDIIVTLAMQHTVDVLMLAECSIAPAILLERLNPPGTASYYYPQSFCDHIKVFTRFPDNFIIPVEESSRLTIRQLTLPGRTDILLAVNHFPSKYNWNEHSQATEAARLASTISRAEERIGHTRTVLVGDLNMNPFEAGVVNAHGLHAVMSRSIAEKRKRTVVDVDYSFFYNPMWGLFGDGSQGPPGTYYYPDSQHNVLFWHMFDQVLIRPDLLPFFQNDNLRIIDSFGNASLLTKHGVPNQRIASDHLPLLFRLSL